MPLFSPDIEGMILKHDGKRLIKMLGYQKDQQIRRSAAGALGRMGYLPAIEPLIAMMKDSNDSVREITAKALGNFRDPRVVDALIAALKDSNDRVRRTAARALGEIGDARAVEPLIAMSKDDIPSVKGSADWALRSIEYRQKKPVPQPKKKVYSTDAINKNELNIIREYLHYLAQNWWNSQPASRTVATCDACSYEPVKHNEGYLIGANLWCEGCYSNKAVPMIIQRGPDVLGPGVFSNAKRWFVSKD